eukprot:8784123-Heterocapsa_arctica.AAC.1
MLGIVLDDDKGRFQLGVLVAEPDTPDPSRKLNVFKIHAMRAVNGHSDVINQEKIATPIRDEHFPLMSAITHKTEARLMPAIINSGIMPGGIFVKPGA